MTVVWTCLLPGCVKKEVSSTIFKIFAGPLANTLPTRLMKLNKKDMNILLINLFLDVDYQLIFCIDDPCKFEFFIPKQKQN